MIKIETINFVKSCLPETPHIAIVLGSGLSSLADDLKKIQTIPFENIPFFPNTTISGHSGQLVFGFLEDVPVLFSKGRFHIYEGLSEEEVKLPVELFSELGIPNFILTNSAGCLNKDWNIGDIMMIDGHVDVTFRSTSEICIMNGLPWYSKNKINLAHKIANLYNINLRNGIYAWTLGPTYETNAEIKFLQDLGASAVGMSTFLEIMASKDFGLNFFGFSCLTNYGAGIENVKLSHKDVLKSANQNQNKFKKFIKKFILSIK